MLPHCLGNRQYLFILTGKDANMQNLGLAVQSYRHFLDAQRSAASSSGLIIAGGYDKRLAENREHFLEIQDMVKQVGLEDQVRSACILTCC